MKRQPINKDNYEEYFLLYVDNELTAAERASVEEYIAMNPGLRAELEIFRSTKLDIEDVKMEGIEELYRHGEGGINAGNYEEFQVLMIDNELNDDDRQALETYHQDHPEAVANFEWLKKTRLPDEEIIFPDKSSLYRTAKKPATIISIRWIRYAAAAAVILLASLLWINYDSNEVGQGQQIATRESEGQRVRESEKNSIAQTKSDSGQILENNTTSISEKVQVAANTTEKPSSEVASEKSTASSNDIVHQSQSPEVKALAKEGGDRKPVKQIPLEGKEKMAIVEQQQIAAVEKNETRISTEDLRLNKTSESPSNATPYVQPAVAMNVKTNYAAEALTGIRDDDNDEMFTEEDGKQRRGLRGIVRKANRIYNKVTNPDLDKPLVKVANLEIGLQR